MMPEHQFVHALVGRKVLQLQVLHARKQCEPRDAFTEPCPGLRASSIIHAMVED